MAAESCRAGLTARLDLPLRSVGPSAVVCRLAECWRTARPVLASAVSRVEVDVDGVSVGGAGELVRALAPASRSKAVGPQSVLATDSLRVGSKRSPRLAIASSTSRRPCRRSPHDRLLRHR